MKKQMKKLMKIAFPLLIAISSMTLISSLNVSAEVKSNPVISRNCPAYSESSQGTASSGNDDAYYSFWYGNSPDYLAYDLSDVPEEQRKSVLAVWYNATGQYDSSVLNSGSSSMPSDYTIEINSAGGGECPEFGWEVAATVAGNTLHSRQHVVEFEGYNWIRIMVTGNDGKAGGTAGINFDIHNVSDGVSDSWIFYGDSITACGMMNCYGTGYAGLVNQIDSNYFPIQENGGIGGIMSTTGVENIDKWLEAFPGKYVSIAYGTNDAWGNQTGAEKYYDNTASMIEKVLESGKTPVIPKIPYSTESGISNYLSDYNEMINKIYETYPEVIKGPDFEELFYNNPDLLSSDGVHPNDEGYIAMRELWAETMYNNVYIANSDDDIIIGDINNDGLIDDTDAKLLSDYLVNKAPINYKNADKTTDLNSDGCTNVFDMVAMRRKLLVKGELTTKSYSATAENVKLIGRTYRDDDTTWLVQSGSAAEFTLYGESAEITLAGDSAITNGADYRPRYAVYVNDVLLTDTTLSTAEEKITLFDGDTSQTSKVKIIHLSEAQNGAIGVKNISVTSDSIVPIKPEAKKDISIEFIGDSITCAYGVEGLASHESFKTTTENFMKSYAYLTADKLNADYSAVSYSGHGIISGYTSSGDKNTESLIPDCYNVVGKSAEYASEWDFEANPNDVVVINLGTNDSGYVSADPEERGPEFIEGYIAFLKTVREKNPDAYIICTLGTMGCEDIYTLVAEAVTQYRTTTGDEEIMSYQSTTQSAADGYGSDYHPSAVTQQNSAYVLSDKICQALGIESDQVGLDVAADSVYDVVMPSELGGNSSFFVAYDKSFWINVVTGGNSPEAIEATLSEISLKKDGEYRLEFDYTSSITTPIPVLIRGESEAYFSDSFIGGSEKAHYSAVFKASETDDDTSIVFQLGGSDYSNLTLSNIKLVKIS